MSNHNRRYYTDNKLFPLPPSLEPLLEGRKVSRWLMDNGNSISPEDFYNKSLTEDDLKAKYTKEVLSKPRRITVAEFKKNVQSLVLMNIRLKDSVDEQLEAMGCEMIDEHGRLRPTNV